MPQLLVRGLGGPRLITRGLASAATQPGPVVAGLITRGLGVGQTLVTGGLRVVSVDYPIGIFEAVASKLASIPAIVSAGLSCWADSKPRGVDDPTLIFKCPSGSLWISDDVSNVYTLRPTLTLMAGTRAEADELGEIVFAAMRGATLAYGSEGRYQTYPWVLQDRRRAKADGETVAGRLVFRDVTDWLVREIRPR